VSVGLWILWVPFGAGVRAETHLPLEDPELTSAACEVCALDGWVVLACVLPPAVDPHAAKVSPRVAVAEQHNRRYTALEQTDIGGA
jgi:hypothetical protein